MGILHCLGLYQHCETYEYGQKDLKVTEIRRHFLLAFVLRILKISYRKEPQKENTCF